MLYHDLLDLSCQKEHLDAFNAIVMDRGIEYTVPARGALAKAAPFYPRLVGCMALLESDGTLDSIEFSLCAFSTMEVADLLLLDSAIGPGRSLRAFLDTCRSYCR